MGCHLVATLELDASHYQSILENQNGKLENEIWKETKSQTCGVGGRGATSIGESAVAFLANVHNARAPSHCCLGFVNEVSISNSTSIPVMTTQVFVRDSTV